jgi:nucleoid-associated protein YgaU
VSTGAVGAAGGATTVLAWAGPGLDPRLDTIDAFVAWAAAVLAWGCVVWLALAALLVVAAQAHGTLGRVSARVAAAVTPRAFRRAVEVALGATLVTGALAAPAALAEPMAATGAAAGAAAGAATGAGAGSAAADTAPAALVVGGDPRTALPSLDRPAPTPGPTPPATPRPAPATPPSAPDVGLVTPAPRAGASVSDEVVVRRGDTLWAIAARHLGPAASNAEIARAWPRWYAANHARIGDDPDVLHPGIRLRPPGGR